MKKLTGNILISVEDYLDLQIKMQRSALAIIINGKPDAKLQLEVGTAILLDKPIIVVAMNDYPVPESLRKIAKVVVFGNIKDEATKERVQAAITLVLAEERTIN